MQVLRKVLRSMFVCMFPLCNSQSLRILVLPISPCEAPSVAGAAQGIGEYVSAVHSYLPLAGGPHPDPAVHSVDLPLWRVHPVCSPNHLAGPSLECSRVNLLSVFNPMLSSVVTDTL